MLRCIVDLEYDRHLGEKRFNVQTGVIRFRIKDKSIGAHLQRLADKEEGLHPSIFIGPRVTKFIPTLVRILSGESNGHATGGRAAGYVKYVRRDGRHKTRGVYLLKSTVTTTKISGPQSTRTHAACRKMNRAILLTGSAAP